jgi:hypothetical protein
MKLMTTVTDALGDDTDVFQCDLCRISRTRAVKRLSRAVKMMAASRYWP